MPNRQQRLRNYQNESILSKDAIGRELVNAANGGGFSPQLRRAAMDALAPSPAEFLRVQGARYGINVPPAAMKRLNDQSSAITTPQRHLMAMASQGRSALGSFGRWAMDAATGARPASAAEWPSFGARGAAPGQFTISMRARGGGGGQDGEGPFMGSKPASKGSLPVSGLGGLARSAGFSTEQAVIMAAIAMAESGGRAKAHNDNRSTGDDSYGLWQINMIDRLGPERRRQFGISGNAALFDPTTNAKAARQVYLSQGFGAWSVYKSGAYRQYLPEARRAITGR
jgi:hypothetical protein